MVRIILATALFLSASLAQALSSKAIALDALGVAAQPNVVALPKGAGYVLSYQAKLAEGCHALRTVIIDQAGKLGAIREVARGCDWFINWADFPSLAIADNGDWLSFYLRKSGAGSYAYDIQTLRSSNQGKSWSKPVKLHDDATESEHGFVSIAPAGGDQFLIAWLDGRHSVAVQHDHSAKHDGAETRMTLRSALLGRRTTVQHALEIDADVCTCCPTDLVRTRANQYALVYRDKLAGNLRDIALASFDGRHWHAKGTVNSDGWRVAGCPVNGPAIAARGAQTLVAWSTMQGEDLIVRTRILGKPMRELERGNILGRVDVAATANAWLMLWLGRAGPEQSAIKLARLNDQLEPLQTITLAELPAGRNVGMPKLASQGDTAIAVWTASVNGATQVVGLIIGLK
jgi:hypothetical protein